jgi:hypothetical protein
VQNVAAGTDGVDPGEVIVTWNANPASDDVDHYNVYRKLDSEADGEPDCGGAFAGPPIASVSAAILAFIDTPPGAGEYCYAVTAVDSADIEGPVDLDSVDWVEVAP